MATKLYTMSNLEGTYEDLAEWFSGILEKGDRKGVTTLDIIRFLDSKGRVPKGILKKTKSQIPESEKVRCCGVTLKLEQCKRDAELGHKFCKLHQVRPPKYTTDDPLDDIRREAEEAKKAKKAKKPRKKKVAKKAKKKTPVDESPMEEESSEGSSEGSPVVSPKSPVASPDVPSESPEYKEVSDSEDDKDEWDLSDEE